MGLFHKQKSEQKSLEEDMDAEFDFLDENFREELRNHGRWYFEKIINKNAALFKEDLDSTIEQINVELKEHVVKELDRTIARLNMELRGHVTRQLDEQFLEYGKVMKEAQDEAMQTLNDSAHAVEDEHQKLSTTLQKSIANQRVMVDSLFQENMDGIAAVKKAQEDALQSLNQSVESIQKQSEELTTTLKENVKKQEEALVSAFENNMAQVIEHYLLGALGDQYDLKAQLPSIMGQLESNKQAIMDDMKL